MVNVVIAQGITSAQTLDVHNFHAVTILNRGGTNATTISISADGTNFVQKTTITGDGIAQITENIMYLKVTPVDATVDIIGEVL